MSILDLVKTDHEQVRKLLEKMLQTTERGVRSREEMSEKLVALMAPHNHSEEKIFYPRLLEVEAAHEKALEALEEHHIAEVLLKQIPKTPPDAEQWKAKVSVFREMIEHHIEEEEGEIFRQAREAFSAEQLTSMGEAFSRAKQAESLRRAA